MLKLVTTAAIAIGFLTGCAATPPLGTPSGRPEVFISGVKPHQVIEKVVERAAIKGNKIKAVTAYNVTMARSEKSVGYALAFGSAFSTFPESRVTVTVVGSPKGTTAYASLEMVTNPGSAFEKSEDMTEPAGATLQALLQEISASLTSVE